MTVRGSDGVTVPLLLGRRAGRLPLVTPRTHTPETEHSLTTGENSSLLSNYGVWSGSGTAGPAPQLAPPHRVSQWLHLLTVYVSLKTVPISSLQIRWVFFGISRRLMTSSALTDVPVGPARRP